MYIILDCIFYLTFIIDEKARSISEFDGYQTVLAAIANNQFIEQKEFYIAIKRHSGLPK